MSLWSSVADFLGGVPNYSGLPTINGPSANNYQINGLTPYLQQLNGLSGQAGQSGQQASQNMGGVAGQYTNLQGQVPGAPDLQGATSGTMGQEGQLQNYLQSIAMGQGQTAADVMLQQGQQTAARNMQSAAVSQGGGMNPALAMRQLYGAQAANAGNIAGQAAQQKLQEQQQYTGMAEQGANQLYGQQFQNQQQGFQNNMANVAQQQALIQSRQTALQQQFADQMSTTQAQNDIANNYFSANNQQTQYNVDLQNAQTAYQTMQYQNQLGQRQAQAQASAGLLHGILSGVGTAGGAVLGGLAGGPMGAVAGGMAGGALLGGGSSGGGGQNSALNSYMAYLQSQQGGGGVSPQDAAAGNNQYYSGSSQAPAGGWYGGTGSSTPATGYSPSAEVPV